MMRRIAACLLCASLLVLASSAGAFVYGPEGQGNPYWVPAVPDELMPTMNGDVSDWEWMPSHWVWTPENFPGRMLGTGEFDWDRDIFDFQVYGPVWFPATNMYGFAQRKHDSVFYIGDGDLFDWRAETNQWCVNPSGEGGPYPEGRTAQQNLYHLLDEQGGNTGFVGTFQHGMDERFRWIWYPPYAYWGITADIVTGSHEFEIMHTLFLYVGDSPEESTILEIEPGWSIGCTLQSKDRDDPDETIRGIAWHFAEPSVDSGNFARCEMMPVSETYAALEAEPPTAVESTSWGMIKSLME